MHRPAHRHLERLNVLRTWRQEQVGRAWCHGHGMEKILRVGNPRTARVPGRWVRCIGWIRLRDAERDVCGAEHMEHAQGYVLTWPRP